MRLVSWNVNGLRAVMKKNFVDALASMDADVICLQETKAQDEQIVEVLREVDHYTIFSNSAVKKGYAGTAMMCRVKPLKVEYDMGIPEHDQEGRVIAAEFPGFFLVTVYTPNSGSELKRLGYRQEWDRDFRRYLKALEKRKPVITCGDFNVAHQEIDLARPKANYNRNAGYMQEEIDGFGQLLAEGFIDTFRHLHSDTVKYSWWSMRAGARARNVGWRIDYFLASSSLADKLRRADILCEVTGSDHCPVLLEVDAALAAGRIA